MEPEHTARRLWELYETVHDVVYFTDECREAAAAIGLRGFWMGYVALRAAPLGPVGPAPVTALFHGFHPDRIERALPDAWAYAGPVQCLDARRDGAVAALRRLCGPGLHDLAALAETADLAWRAAAATDVAGRALGAANRLLPRPADPVAAVWQACTTLREHRGDGHVAVLVARGVDPVEAHLLKAAAVENDTELLREARRWSVEAWRAGADRLRTRGWTDGTDRLTPAGEAEHREIEHRTDLAAAAPWAVLGEQGTDRLAELLTPWANAVAASGVLPRGNPTGLVRQPDVTDASARP